MDDVHDLVDYYDNFFPLTLTKKKFFKSILSVCKEEGGCNVLAMHSNVGTLERYLAEAGCSVTGVEYIKPFINAAMKENIKEKDYYNSPSYINIPITSIAKVFPPASFNLIYSLSSRLSYLNDKGKFFSALSDCRFLLKKGGLLVLQLYNYERLINKHQLVLKRRNCIRASLETVLRHNDSTYTITQRIKKHDKKILPLLTARPVFPISPADLITMARTIGFSDYCFYSNFELKSFSEKDEDFICVMA